MDPKHAGSGPEVQALRNQLQEKERHIEQLEVSRVYCFDFHLKKHFLFQLNFYLSEYVINHG